MEVLIPLISFSLLICTQPWPRIRRLARHHHRHKLDFPALQKVRTCQQ